MDKSARLDVVGVIKEAFYLYRDNFMLFFKISLIIFLINVVHLFSINMKDMVATPLRALFIIINFFAFFIYLYFSIKFPMTQIVCISKRYLKQETNIKDSYTNTNGLFWKYFGALFLLGLVMLIPVVIILLSFRLGEFSAIKLILIIPMVILEIYLYVNYSLVTYIRILNPNEENYFKYSKGIVSRQFWGVLTVILISEFIMWLIMAYNYFVLGNNASWIQKMLLGGIENCISLILSPFFIGVLVITYYKLSEKQEEQKVLKELECEA